jgi:hypothetical protein
MTSPTSVISEVTTNRVRIQVLEDIYSKWFKVKIRRLGCIVCKSFDKTDDILIWLRLNDVAPWALFKIKEDITNFLQTNRIKKVIIG